MNYEEAVRYVLEIPRFAAEKHELSKLQVFLDALGNPDRQMKIVHVAGTNGKGSVCAFLEQIFRESGQHTAMFTSPHLVKVNERFRFDGEPVDDAEFVEGVLTVLEIVERLRKTGAHHPTFFEFMFLIFMALVKQHPSDVVILETGMGGRLDATNVIRHPALTVITSVSMDHMQYLGRTLSAIAGEKAGIIKPGVPVVCDGNCPETLSVITDRAAEDHCSVYAVDKTWYHITDMGSTSISLEGRLHGNDTIQLTLPFAAEYQADNVMVAAVAAELLGVGRSHIRDGVRKTRWPGRMEAIADKFYLDGAHNEDGIRAFVKTAARLAANISGKVYLLLAISSDKEHGAMTRTICEQVPFDVLYVTQADVGRRLDIDVLEAEAKGLTDRPVEARASAMSAVWELMEKKGPEDLVFCAGSLYLIGEIKKGLKDKE